MAKINAKSDAIPEFAQALESLGFNKQLYESTHGYRAVWDKIINQFNFDFDDETKIMTISTELYLPVA